MSNLLERAKALISSKPAVLGALVIVPLANAALTTDAVGAPFTFGSGSSTFTTGSGASVAFNTSSGCSASLTGTELSLFTTGPITVPFSTYFQSGATSFNLQWTGTLDSSSFQPKISNVEINYDFSTNFSGSGTIGWALNDNIGGMALDASGVIQSGGIAGIEGTLSAPVTTALNGAWSTDLELKLAGFSGGTTGGFTVSVPEGSSIDLAVVPEPASLGVLGLGALGLLARRRQRT